MFSWCSSLIILSVYALVSEAGFKVISYPADDRSDVESHVTGTRWSRSVPGIAEMAVRALLKGTKEVPTNSPVYTRKFLKQGSDLDAVNDFNSLNSKIVRTDGYGAIGVIGDIKVKLRMFDGNHGGRPTVQVLDPKRKNSVRIVYTNEQIL